MTPEFERAEVRTILAAMEQDMTRLLVATRKAVQAKKLIGGDWTLLKEGVRGIAGILRKTAGELEAEVEGL
jgi:hypothetical protein